jgi:L-amino acid N-acyltransferase YncA
MARAFQTEQPEFAFLPARVRDREGRLFLLKPQEPGDFFGLMHMYDRFEPKGLAQGLPPPDRQAAARWVRQLARECFNLIALHEGRIVAHAILTDLGPERAAELAVFVDQAFRHHGLGTELTRWACRCATEAHCKLLWALVQRYNRPALQVCRKVGFCITQDRLEPDLEMRLRLDRPPH